MNPTENQLHSAANKCERPGKGSPVAPAGVASSLRQGRWWLARLLLQGGVLFAVLLAGIAFVGLAQRFGWIQSTSGSQPAAADDRESGDILYICPMHPNVRQDKPGRCHICGMELVLASTLGQRTDGPAVVTITPAARRIAGIRTATARSGDVEQTIRAVGRISFDEERVATIAAYVEGRIEKLFAEYVGVKVSIGDDLAVLYSPTLYSAQVEYLSSLSTSALDTLVAEGNRLSGVAQDRLRELGMTEAQIEELRRSGQAQKRLPIKSPIGGTVIAKQKLEGDYVNVGEPIYRVADLSAVWLMLELYPGDAAVVRFGQQVEVNLQSLPGETFTGRVGFVDPMVNEQTRTVAVRVEMANDDGRLKPGDFAAARVRVPAVPRATVYDPALAGKWISPMHPQIVRDEPGQCPICGMDLIPTSELGYAPGPLPAADLVTVPRGAVLMAGDSSVVYVESEPGEFEMRRVVLGPLTDTEAVVLDGVQPGEQVATDGNFLIDSQMQLLGKPSLLDPSRTAGSAQGAKHDH